MLINLKEILKYAKKGINAIPAFNTPNLVALNAVICAAEKEKYPVIISHAELHENIMSLDIIGPIMVEMAKKATVPVCVHLDHGEHIEYCKKALDLGFTSAMFDGSTLPFEENIKKTKEVVDYAHSIGASVEAELGSLPNREGGGDNTTTNGIYTDPKLVPEFVNQTDVDALAIAFGTAHGLYKSTPKLDLEIINNVESITDIPLVMHGGSGLSNDTYKEVIKRGIQKINYFSYMSFEGYQAVKNRIEEKEEGFFFELINVATEAMKKTAVERIKLFSGREN